MLKLFLLIFYIAASSLVNAYAKDDVPQSFEDIAADLKAKKAAMEPFDQKKVKKVDIESLGLDPLEDKSKAEEKIKEDPNNPQAGSLKAVEKDVKSLDIKGLAKDLEKAEMNEIKGNLKKAKEIESAVVSETKVMAGDVEDLFSKASKGSKTKNYVNTASKKKLKDRLNKEKSTSKTKNEKAQEKKALELQTLQKKYLLELNKEELKDLVEGDDLEESNFESDKKIIPVRKEVGKFDSHEPFAPPIINNYRTKDNVHIPLVATHGELVKFLFDSITNQDISVFNANFKNVGDVNVKNYQGDTVLTYAILMRKYPVVASILAKGADPSMPNKLGFTPMSIVIELSDSKSLELLLKNNVDLNYLDAYKRNYLMQASRVGFLPAIEIMIKNGADINALDSDGFSAVAIAQRNNQDVAVKYLVKNGAKLLIEKPYDPESQTIMNELWDRWK